MTTLSASTSLTILAHESLDRAVAAENRQNVFDANAAYLQALEFASQAISRAENDGEAADARLAEQDIQDAYNAFKSEWQPDTTIWDRMGHDAIWQLLAMPPAQRNHFVAQIDAQQRMNDIDQEIARLRAAIAA